MSATAVGTGTSWTRADSSGSTEDISILRIDVKCDESRYIQGLYCQLGSGNGTIYGSDHKSHTYTGDPVTASLLWGSSLEYGSEATVSKSVGVASTGSAASSGWFSNVGGNPNYNTYFNLISETFPNGVQINPGDTLSFRVRVRGRSGNVLTSYKAESQSIVVDHSPELRGTVTVNYAPPSPILYGEKLTLTGITSSISGYQDGADPQISRKYFQVRTQSQRDSGSPATEYAEGATITVTERLYIRACAEYVSKYPDRYTGTVSGIYPNPPQEAKIVECKLNAPEPHRVKEDGQKYDRTDISIGNVARYQLDESSVKNPSGCKVHWQRQLDVSGNFEDISMPYTVDRSLKFTSSPEYFVNFRCRVSKDGYVISDWTPDETLNVFYEPRNMKLAVTGYSPTFSYVSYYRREEDNPEVTEINENFDQTVLLLPRGRSRIRVEVPEFPSDLDYGRFNYFRVTFISESGQEIYKSEGKCEFSYYGKFSIDYWLSAFNDIIGKRIQVKLDCLCQWEEDGETTIYGPAENGTATFESVFFLVGAPPGSLNMIYPYKNLVTCNVTPRIIFTVSNFNRPDTQYEPLTDITVSNIRLPGGIVSYSYSSSPESFDVRKNSEGRPLLIDHPIIFYFPEGYLGGSTSSVTVSCKNQYAEVENPAEFFVNPRENIELLLEPTKNEIMTKELFNSFKEKFSNSSEDPWSTDWWLGSYYNILKNSKLIDSDFWKDPDNDYVKKVDPMSGYTIPQLEKLYEYIVKNYGYHRNLSEGDYKNFFNFVNLSGENLKVTADTFNPPPSTEPFDVEGGHFVDKGSYFTFVYYALKYLL